MTDIDTARLRARAEAATPGPWTTMAPRPDGRNAVQRPEGYTLFGEERNTFLLVDTNPDDAAYIAAADPPTMLALLDEIERLRQWKAEAMDVLSEWEKAWIAAGRPGRLGTSKAAGVREEIERLQGDAG